LLFLSLNFNHLNLVKVFLFIPLFGLLALASCKKKYTCECTTTKHYDSYVQNGVMYDYLIPEVTTSTRTIKDKKDAAKSACESGNKVSYEPGPQEQNGQGPTEITTVCTIFK